MDRPTTRRPTAQRPPRHVPAERNTAYPDTDYGLARYTGDVQTASGLSFLLGLWLVVAAWVVGYTSVSLVVWDEVAVGAVVSLLALLRLMAPLRFESTYWVDLVLGGWLVVVPWVLSYPAGVARGAVLWNHVLCGAAVLLVASWNAAVVERAAVVRHRLTPG